MRGGRFLNWFHWRLPRTSFTNMKIKDLEILKLDKKVDNRGWFAEVWSNRKVDYFAQENASFSKRWVLRGLHWQNRQAKLISVTSGVIFDVVVDLREEEPTYLSWYGQNLGNDGTMIYVPAGCAHGFLTLSEFAEVRYCVSSLYDPSQEACLRWDSAQINVRWPLPPMRLPILSDKDANAPLSVC